MVSADDDRRLDGATSDELVEAQAGAGTLAVAEPADARRQPLELHLLARRSDPAHKGSVIGELLDDGAVGDGDVLGVTRERHPSKRALPFAEQGPDVRRHEARKLECAGAAAQLRLRAQAV